MKSIVQLQVPGRPEFVRVARLAISGVASCAGCSVDQLEEIKQSVGEACSNAVAASQRAGEGPVVVRCDVAEGEMVIEVSPVAFGPEDIKDERTEFQFFLIKTLMDDVQVLGNGSGEQTLRMKRGLSR